MKKIVPTCMLIGGAYQLKLQQLQVKPANNLAKQINKYIKLQLNQIVIITY
jgi:hypothetical protein